jgi:serine/threonine protein kinase
MDDISLPSLKTAVLSGNYQPIPSVYSEELAHIISRLLQLNPRDRPQARYVLVHSVRARSSTRL